MKYSIWTIIVILVFVFGCKTKNPCDFPKDIVNSETQMKSIFINDFKLRYFTGLLQRGFNNDKGYKNAVKDDMSFFGDILLSDYDRLVMNQLIEKDNNAMIKDSLESFGKRAEGTEGKRVFKYALDRYNSKWLDSLANARYKLYEALEKEYQDYLKSTKGKIKPAYNR